MTKKKSITWLLPAGAGLPSGGAKVVFEYANRLVLDGYEVHVMMSASLLWIEESFKEKCKALLRYPYYIILKKYEPYNWFNLNRKVKLHFTWSLDQCYAPKTDIYIATAVETAEYLDKYKDVVDDNKYYFIQHFENWNMPDCRVKKTYTLQLNKITIASWLKNIIEECGSNTCLVENGFNFSEFRLSIPINEKNKFSVTMLYHHLEVKGCKDGFDALKIVRRTYPQMRLIMFGFPDKPRDLPSWVEYYKEPDKKTHNEIYNKSAIFLGTSHYEGWGLTIGEAMMCGSAVVCTDNDGYAEMVTNGETGLMSKIKNPEGLAANIIKLIENDELRFFIAKNGAENIKKFTWERAYLKFKNIIDK